MTDYSIPIISKEYADIISETIVKSNDFFKQKELLLTVDDIYIIQKFQSKLAAEEIDKAKGFKFHKFCTFRSIANIVKECKQFNTENSNLPIEEYKANKRQKVIDNILRKKKGKEYRLRIKKIDNYIFSYGTYY